jgi:hypothetical protein
MRRELTLWVLMSGCVQTGASDVTGPFTGTPRRYVIDRIELPTNNNEARGFGLDVNGDDTVDNTLGMVVSTLGQYNDITKHGDDQIASGVIASSVVVVANDYWQDDAVSVTYYGGEGDGSMPIGGTFESGVFRSNVAATTSLPGAATLRLPIFVDAGPSDIRVRALQMRLTPLGDGFDAVIGAIIDRDQALELTHTGLAELIAAEPTEHRQMLDILDTNRNFELTLDEVKNNSLMQALFYPDLNSGSRRGLSFGFHAHFSPCDDGTCSTAAPEHACFDRVKDEAETDVDCGGGSCRTCKAGEACTTGTDCDSGACDGGICRAPTCFDGVRDGFETDVDCGGDCAANCALDAHCYNGSDCASGNCSVSIGGVCTQPPPP